MKTDEFDYELPEKFIAQYPAEPRDSCKLMVVGPGSAIEHRVFSDIIDYLHPGDLLVVNDTRVLPARLLGVKEPTGAAVETLLLDKVHGAPDDVSEQSWNCLVKPGKRLKPGAKVSYRDDDSTGVLRAEIVSIDPENGSRAVRFTLPDESPCASVDEAIHRVGHAPLPPYITSFSGDEELYQTVYARNENSAAAPTAGLHFTTELLDRIREKGVEFATVDLEVGLDTFRTVSVDDVRDHAMHTELYTVPQATVEAVRRAKERGGRVVAVGTTSVRSLESAAADGSLHACAREATSLFILPGYTFKVVDAIVTNFHVPRSTLMMLVSAFCGRDVIMDAYETAKRRDYRFFSFGDAMLLQR